MEDFLRWQILGSPTTESDEGTGRRAAGSGAISTGYLCLRSQDRGRRWQAVPERRAVCGPSTGSGAAAVPFRHTGTATGSNEAGVPTRGRRLARDATAVTCLRRRNVRPPGIICKRLKITAVRRVSCDRHRARERLQTACSAHSWWRALIEIMSPYRTPTGTQFPCQGYQLDMGGPLVAGGLPGLGSW